MLSRLRHSAPAIALLVCVALLATWLTGAHAHRHVGWSGQESSLQASPDLHADDGHGHEHEHPHLLDALLVLASDMLGAAHDADTPLAPHPVSLIHHDGHENVEVQAVQPSFGKASLDLPLFALLCFAVLMLRPGRERVTVFHPQPPAVWRAAWTLRPPLRGPPSFSVA